MEPEMKDQAELTSSVSSAQARGQFAEVVNRAAYGKERVLLSRHNRVVAAVVPIEDVNLLQDMEDRLDLETAHAALAEAERQGTKPLAQLRVELGL